MYRCTRDVDNCVRKSRGGSGYSECKYKWADLQRQVVNVCLYFNIGIMSLGAILVQTSVTMYLNPRKATNKLNSKLLHNNSWWY